MQNQSTTSKSKPVQGSRQKINPKEPLAGKREIFRNQIKVLGAKMYISNVKQRKMWNGFISVYSKLLWMMSRDQQMKIRLTLSEEDWGR